MYSPSAVFALRELFQDARSQPTVIVGAVALFLLVVGLLTWLTTRYIPNKQAGVVEKLWSVRGSVAEGGIVALHGEAGYQVELLRGGLHFGLWRWQYRLHKVPLVTIPQGKIGYIYARDGESLPPSQTLGRVVECNHFQDARGFLGEAGEEGAASVRGQRGRQRAILREGVYAINPALFVVITEDAVYRLSQLLGSREGQAVAGWQDQLKRIDGFSPIIIGGSLRSLESSGDDAIVQRRVRSRSSRGEEAVEESATIKCPGCGHRFTAPASSTSGEARTVKCPECGQPVRIFGAAIPETLPPLDVEAQLDVDTIGIVT